MGSVKRVVWLNLIFDALLFILILDSFAMAIQKDFPETLLECIYWSFKEPMPDLPNSLIEAVEDYHSEINEAFDQKFFLQIHH